MIAYQEQYDELAELLTAMSDTGLDARQSHRLAELLENDADARQFYLDFVELHTMLIWECQAETRITADAERESTDFAEARSSDTQPASEHSAPSAAGLTLPTIVVTPTLDMYAPGALTPGMILFSYVMAIVITGFALLLCSTVQVSDFLGLPKQYVASPKNSSGGIASSPTLNAANASRPALERRSIGRITGMFDCRWASMQPVTHFSSGDRVAVGDRIALASGVVEITYDGVAKVLLQGPVVYEIDTHDGGYLSLGKLTARVEKKGDCGQGSVVSCQKSKPQSPIPNSALFAIRTPTAVVTDLGTEFGVDVNREGQTETHVFVGRRRLVGRGQANAAPPQIIQAGQAARFAAKTITLVDPSQDNGNQEQFVREMPSHVMGHVDYSDTWSANSPTRSGSYELMTTPESLKVEDCHGNPQRSWVFSSPAAMTTWPYDHSPVRWPGFQVAGSRDGFMECGGIGTCYFGLKYGLRDDFVVQTDAVQTDDRINITIGDKPATIDGQQSLSVFFRAPNKAYPEIGVYTLSKLESETGLKSGIATPLQWHNYAVRFNLREKKLTVWVDCQERGTIDLTHITKGMKLGGTWADLPWTNRYVTIGGYTAKPPARVWTDNFRVGSPYAADASTSSNVSETIEPETRSSDAKEEKKR
jgi:hypothetical protein